MISWKKTNNNNNNNNTFDGKEIDDWTCFFFFVCLFVFFLRVLLLSAFLRLSFAYGVFHCSNHVVQQRTPGSFHFGVPFVAQRRPDRRYELQSDVLETKNQWNVFKLWTGAQYIYIKAGSSAN